MAAASDPVHRQPGITELTLARELVARPSPTWTLLHAIWPKLLAGGVDPAFAYGHFWAESRLGTEGWNVWADLHSWAGALWATSRLATAGDPRVERYEASNGYDYARYDSWPAGVEDYAEILGYYAVPAHFDSRYGDSSTIYGATARWSAKVPGSPGHTKYLGIVLDRMDRISSATPLVGDAMLDVAIEGITTKRRYVLRPGTKLYEQAGGPSYGSYAGSKPAYPMFGGRVLGSSWGLVYITTQHATTGHPTRKGVYVTGVVEDDLIRADDPRVEAAA